jgi:predicted metalloprotease with PDZ domain
MGIEGLHAQSVDLRLPAWIPGSYKVRDFAKHIQGVKGGVSTAKIDKQTWRVQTGGRRNLTVRYKVYAFELTVRTSHVDSDHAFLNPGSVFLHVVGRKTEPHEVRIRIPRGWKVATGLPRKGNAWRAEDYDHLVDCPIEISRFERSLFRVRGKEHEFVICGPGNHDLARLTRDTTRVVEAAAKLFGGLPYDRYVFIMHSADKSSGGLEHTNSTALQVARQNFQPEENYRRVLRLVTHEYFHTWNVKRIIPGELLPWDLSREVHTDLLWLSEGFTNYYTLLLLGRSGLLDAGEVRDTITQWLTSHEQKPGRFVQSVSEASFDAWIKLYQADENTVNTTISYYEKGQIIGLLLDMEIRKRSRGRRSLDDVMRRLEQEFGRKGRGVFKGDVIRLAEEAAGGSLAAFFRDYVDGVRPLPVGRALRSVGLKVSRSGGRKKKGGYLGISTEKRPETIVLSTVLSGSPAEACGLSARDEIVAVDGARISPEGWNRFIETSEPGRKATFSLFREGLLKEVQVRLGAPPDPPMVMLDRKASKQARRAHRSWIGHPWS